jgi:hypothetical protein
MAVPCQEPFLRLWGGILQPAMRARPARRSRWAPHPRRGCQQRPVAAHRAGPRLGLSGHAGSHYAHAQRWVEGGAGHAAGAIGGNDVGIEAALVLVIVGVCPNRQLAVAAGVQTGVRGRCGWTKARVPTCPTSWPAGECVETYHRLLDQPTYLPLGATPTSRAGSPARRPPRPVGRLLGTQVVRCSSWPRATPSSATPKQPPPTWICSPSARLSSAATSTTPVLAALCSSAAEHPPSK